VTAILRGNHITVRYGSNAVVDDLSFHLEEGQWLMLAGPNGAGKTTLIEAIAQGVPYTGSIQWENQELCSLKPSQLAQKIGVLSQRNNVGYAYTVEEVGGSADMPIVPVSFRMLMIMAKRWSKTRWQ